MNDPMKMTKESLVNALIITNSQLADAQARQCELEAALEKIANYEWEYDLENIPDCDVLYLNIGERIRTMHIPSGIVGDGIDKKSAATNMKNYLSGWISNQRKKHAQEIKPLVEIANNALKVGEG